MFTYPSDTHFACSIHILLVFSVIGIYFSNSLHKNLHLVLAQLRECSFEKIRSFINKKIVILLH